MPALGTQCTLFRVVCQAEPGRGRNSQNESQPNPGLPGDVSPCTSPHTYDVGLEKGRNSSADLWCAITQCQLYDLWCSAVEFLTFSKPSKCIWHSLLVKALNCSLALSHIGPELSLILLIMPREQLNNLPRVFSTQSEKSGRSRGEPIPGVWVAWSWLLWLFSGMQLRNQLIFSGVDSSESATLSQNLTSSTLHNQKLLIKKTQIEPKLVDF